MTNRTDTRMATREVVDVLFALWRWVVSHYARELLSQRVDEIVRTNGMDSDVFSAALEDHRAFMLMVSRGEDNAASKRYNDIVTSYPIKVVELTRCATLLRHGLFKGQLSAADYDVTRLLCMNINLGQLLVPLLRKIERAEKWMS